MIIKVIEPKINRKDNYNRLANYIMLGKSHDGQEKVCDAWIRNCHNGTTTQELDLCLLEINAVRDMNQRAKYRSQHIVVSFANNEYPDTLVLQDIERNITKTLGYESHQYVVGIHHDRDHYHMHIAINQIDPNTYKKHSPHRNYPKLQKLALELERKHHLYEIQSRYNKEYNKKTSNSINDSNRYYQRYHTASQDFKSHTWQQSFLDHCKNLTPSINNDMRQAKNWQDVHHIFANHHLKLKKRANGLVITQLQTSDIYNKPVYIKASDFGRAYSLKNLEKTYGAFEPPQQDLKTHKINNQHQNQQIQHKAKPYNAIPLKSCKKTSQHHKQLWYQFIKHKPHNKIKSSLAPVSQTTKANIGMIKNWKQYLFMMSQVGNDPLAIAVITSTKMMLNQLSLQSSSHQKLTKQTKQQKNKNNGLEM